MALGTKTLCISLTSQTSTRRGFIACKELWTEHWDPEPAGALDTVRGGQHQKHAPVGRELPGLGCFGPCFPWACGEGAGPRALHRLGLE